MTLRSRYWSNSALANWIWKKVGEANKPIALTSQGWRRLEKDRETNHPITYLIVEELFDDIQDLVYWPLDKIRDAKHYLQNRFITKTHYANTYLKKGQWYDTDTRMLHAIFGLLVDYVEIELGSYRSVGEDLQPTPWYKHIFSSWTTNRSPEQGIAHLEWERSLADSDGVSHQAVAAEEVRALYAWWTVTRPNRFDPYNYVRGLYEEKGFMEETDVSRADRKASYEKLWKLETIYKQEDENMLIRLIRIRESLWT